MDTIYWHMNATQGDANLHPGENLHPRANLHPGAICAYEQENLSNAEIVNFVGY